MTTLDPQTLETTRQGFKYLNRLMLLQWRLGLGPWLSLWPEALGQYLVITHTGRKTGLRRRTPVNFAEVDGELYVTAGFGPISDWYRNIKADPRVEIWTPKGWWTAWAEEMPDEDPRWLALMREVLRGSGFAGRVFGFDVQTMSDAELKAATRGYRLFHLRKEQPRTGPDGPGDLVWVWPVLVLFLLRRAFRRRR